jgi:hypothetical protein
VEQAEVIRIVTRGTASSENVAEGNVRWIAGSGESFKPSCNLNPKALEEPQTARQEDKISRSCILPEQPRRGDYRLSSDSDKRAT